MNTDPVILMCPPDFYGIEYEINAWMNRERPADAAEAAEQWHGLRDVLEGIGARIQCMAPVETLPDLVFTANAALIFEDRAILSRFRPRERRPEQERYADWLRGFGFDVTELPEDAFFEGAGDALFCGDTLWAGYRMRSAAKTLQALGEKLGVRVIPLELMDPYFYHLDTCFCPLDADTAIYYPAAFDDYGRRVLHDAIPRLIEISDDEARAFAANAVVVGEHVVTNEGCAGLHESLAEIGFVPIATPLDEFTKAGGSAKCLTLRLDGEDAARWSSRP